MKTRELDDCLLTAAQRASNRNRYVMREAELVTMRVHRDSRGRLMSVEFMDATGKTTSTAERRPDGTIITRVLDEIGRPIPELTRCKRGVLRAMPPDPHPTRAERRQAALASRGVLPVRPPETPPTPSERRALVSRPLRRW